MRVDLRNGNFISTPFTLTAPATLTETSNPVDLACESATASLIVNAAFESELTAIQVGTLH